MDQSERIFLDLLRETPSLHGQDGSFQWGLPKDVLRWLFDSVSTEACTLETGCGYSTIIFALKGARHTVVSPAMEEHSRIVNWGRAHGVDFSNVTFLPAKSEDVLPKMDPTPLDVVLIDGWHAFPGPFIDWFYTCQRLKVSGKLIVDDTQIRSCRILRDFLCQERGRWQLEHRLNRTDIFRKLKANVFEGEWRTQPYNAVPIVSLSWRWNRMIQPRVISGLGYIPGVIPMLRAARSIIRKP